jgi:dienelactone hydrolase
MKRLASRLTPMTALLLLLFWTAAGTEAAAGADIEAASLQELAGEYVRLLAGGRYSEAAERHDDTMKQALPEGKLADVWRQVQAQAGPFRESIGTRMGKLQGYDVAYVTCRFEQANLDVKIVYNDRRQVAGLFFVPASSPAPPPPVERILPEDVVEEEIIIGREPWLLPGTLSLPRGGGPHPGLALVHGSGPQDRDETIGPNKPFRDLAWGLASRGVAVLRYEKRTLQHRDRLAAAGASMTVKEETVDDALSAALFLKERPGMDPKRIFVLGHSLGGMLVPRIAARSGDDVAGFIIMAGATRPLEESIIEQVSYISGLDGELSEAEKARLGQIEEAAGRIARLSAGEDLAGATAILGAPPAYWLDLKGYRPHEAALEIQQPLLILQGGRDYQVTEADLRRWQEALGTRPGVRFKLYEALNHLFMPGEGRATPEEYQLPGTVAEEVIDEIASWILRSHMTPLVRPLSSKVDSTGSGT